MEKTKTSIRIQELDALRLFAAIGVVLYHLTYTNSPSTPAFPEIDWITRYGYLGVDLFFLISGFVILWSAHNRTLWQFAVSRVARLYPLFWLALAITALIVPNVTLSKLFTNATMVAGYLGQDYIDGVYWTLQVELKFYVLIGVLLALRQGQKFELWLAIWLVASIGAEFVPTLRSIVIYPYSPLFIGGAVCFLIRSQGSTWWRLCLLATSAILATFHAGPSAKGFIQGDVGIIPSIIVFSIFVIAWLIATNRLRLRCASSAAAITYPLYLVHNELGRAVFKTIQTPNEWVSLVLTLTIILVFAFALSLLDKPLGNYVKRCAEQFRAFTKSLIANPRAN